MAVGGVTIGAGLLIATIPDRCEGKLICIENEEAGGFIAVIGLAILGLGVVQYAIQESEPKRPGIQPGQVLSNGSVVPPAPFPIAPDPIAEEQPLVVIDPNQPPLPAAELSYSDATQRQFAFQASSAARRGNCAAAIASGKRLQIEVEQKLLAADDAYARCVSGQ